MIAGVFWTIVANAATLLGAWALLTRVRSGNFAVDLVLFLLLRLALITGAVLIAGLAGALHAAALGGAGAVALAALLAVGVHRSIPRPRRPAVRRLWIAAFAVVLVRQLLYVWFLAPYAGDALSYHLPKVAEWVGQGAITGEVGPDPRATFPAGFELVEIWWVVFLHHDLLIEMAGLEFLVLGAAATFALARVVGAGAPAASFAALLYALAPAPNMQAFSCLNDAPAAALYVATAALLMARVPVGLPLLAAGLAAGVKPTFGYALPGLLVLGFLARREPPAAGGDRRWSLGLAAAGALLGGSWYLRNAWLYGSPLHPMGARGFVTEQGMVLQQLGPSLESLMHNLRRVVDSRIYDRLQPYNVLCEYVSGWGSAAFAVGLPALLWGLREDAKLRRVAAGFAASLVSVCLLVASDPWFVRFLMFMPALFAVATARLAERVRPAAAVASAAMAFQFVSTLVPFAPAVNSFGFFARQGWRERAAFAVSSMPPPGEPVACAALGGSKIYLLYGPDFSRKVVYIRSAEGGEIVARMKAEGIRWVFATGPAARGLRECARRGLVLPALGNFFELP